MNIIIRWTSDEHPISIRYHPFALFRKQSTILAMQCGNILLDPINQKQSDKTDYKHLCKSLWPYQKTGRIRKRKGQLKINALLSFFDAVSRLRALTHHNTQQNTLIVHKDIRQLIYITYYAVCNILFAEFSVDFCMCMSYIIFYAVALFKCSQTLPKL